MPVIGDGSVSPPMRQASLEPPSTQNDAGPSKKMFKNTVVDQQRRQLERLLANPEKEVQLPLGVREKTLRAPREMMKNVQGSSAGAGSGEFHVYKQSRRREYERLKIMDDKARAEEEQAAFQARQAAREAEADAKTAKNRAKRQKRKAGRGGKGGSSTPAGDDDRNGGANSQGGGVGKRKLEGGAKVVFKRPGEESEDDEGDEEVGPTPVVDDVPVAVEAEAPRVVEEPKITIVDED
ncbi:hypothetical protein IAU60_005173 [Kwoniella sp. DSM 27419]